MVLITCINDKASKTLKLNKTYQAIEDNNNYIIPIKENDIIVSPHYRRKYVLAKKKFFIKH